LPVSFPTAATDAMRKGTKLVIASLNLSTNEPVTFNVSLDGFGAALARAADLAR
jgi:invasion protein IalB